MPVVSADHMKQLASFIEKAMTELPSTEKEHSAALQALENMDDGMPELLKKLGKWFNAKDWGLFLVRVPACTDPPSTSVCEAVQNGDLVALPLDSPNKFTIAEGLESGATVYEEGWTASDLPENAQAILKGEVAREEEKEEKKDKKKDKKEQKA